MKYIIDADTWIYKLAYLNDDKEKSECYINAISYIESQLRQLNINNNNYTLVIQGKNNFRYNVCPEYKAKRTKPDWQYFNYIKHDIIKNNFKWLSIDGVESDDILASFAAQKNDIILVHDDKDELQIPGIHIYRNKLRVVSETEAYVNLMIQVLTGDSTDGIKGVRGVGIKTAERLLKNANIVNMLDIVIKEYVRVYENEGLKEFYKNYNLIKLKHNVELE